MNLNNEERSGPAFPISIGGVGGSGTRVVASILAQLGYYLGSDLNNSNDNEWYTFLFKRRSVLDNSGDQIENLARIFFSAMSGQVDKDPETIRTIEDLAAKENREFSPAWLYERSDSLRTALRRGGPFVRWSWKEPNTHVLIDKLAVHMPKLRYIHVIRDGRDLAFGSNKNQLRYWPDLLFGMTDFDSDAPAALIHYWRLVNERIAQFREDRVLPILEVGLECLCESPTEQILAIAAFCGVAISKQQAHDIGAQEVRMQPGIYRHRDMDCSVLDADDCRYAEETRARLIRELEAPRRVS